MSQSTDSSAPQQAPDEGADVIDAAEVTLVDTESARAYPGRVRGQRLEITSNDLMMYSAITGRAPSAAERERALTWSETDPIAEQLAPLTQQKMSDSIGPSSSSSAAAALAAHALRPWSPASLSLRLRELWQSGFALKVARPQIGTWLRRFSSALQQGRRRVEQAGRAVARTARHHHLW